MSSVDTLKEASWYPWSGGGAGVTLVVGGVLTLLSPLVIPALFVLGYGLRVVEAVMDGEERPPAFGDWGAMFVDGIKGAIVLVAYVVLPLVVGTAIVVAAAGAAGFRSFAGPVSMAGALTAGGLVFALVLMLAGLVLVVWYFAPAALVHLGRTGRLGAAFAVGDVRDLAASHAYGSAWLLALVIFAASAVVLAVLNAAAIGVVVSGFVTFYAFVAMTYLYSHGARETGFELADPPEQGDEAATETG